MILFILSIFLFSMVGTCRIWTKLGGNCSQESPGAFSTARGPKQQAKTKNTWNSKVQKCKTNQNFKNFKFADSRHAQLSIYAVFHDESDVQVKSKEIWGPKP